MFTQEPATTAPAITTVATFVITSGGYAGVREPVPGASASKVSPAPSGSSAGTSTAGAPPVASRHSLQVYKDAVLQRTGHCAFIQVLQPFVTLFGKDDALLLSHLIYCAEAEGRDGWVCKSEDQLRADTGLTRRNINAVRKRLVKLGVVAVETRRPPSGRGRPVLAWSVGHAALLNQIQTLPKVGVQSYTKSKKVGVRNASKSGLGVQSATLLDSGKSQKKTKTYIDHSSPDLQDEEEYGSLGPSPATAGVPTSPEFGTAMPLGEPLATDAGVPAQMPPAANSPPSAQTEDSHPTTAVDAGTTAAATYRVFLDKAQGGWRVDGDEEAFVSELFACADYAEVNTIARRYAFVEPAGSLPDELAGIWFAGQFRYWQAERGTTEDYDFAGKLKKRFAVYFGAGRVKAEEVQALSYLWSFKQFGVGINPWLDAKPERQDAYRVRVEILGRDLVREYSSLFAYTKWLKEAAEAGESASLTLACLLGPNMPERFLQETEGERFAARAKEDRKAYLARWMPVAEAQLSHLEARVHGDEALTQLRYWWNSGHKDPQNAVRELAVIAARHGIAPLTDAEIEAAMAGAKGAGESGH